MCLYSDVSPAYKCEKIYLIPPPPIEEISLGDFFTVFLKWFSLTNPFLCIEGGQYYFCAHEVVVFTEGLSKLLEFQ